MSETMNAVRIHDYGGPDRLKLEQAPVPELKPEDVLVRVHAAAVNPVDWKVREGMLREIVPHELPLIPGWDFAGEVVEVGSDVTAWSAGDAVYGRPDITRNGSYAEYIAVNAGEIAAKPRSLDWEQAAAVPLAALTAWQALYDRADLKPGDRVLIHAGAGGVGTFAIQLAHLRRAYIYTTASAANAEFVKNLGADEVIDYTSEDFSTLQNLDVVFDTLGGEVQDRCWQTLRRGGRLVSITQTPDPSTAEHYGVHAGFWFVQPNSAQLTEIARLLDDGVFRVCIDKTFPLEQVAEAHEESEGGHARGKIVLQAA